MRLPAPNALIGGTIIGIVIVCALFGAVWTPFDPLKLNFAARLQPPGPSTCSAPTSSAATC